MRFLVMAVTLLALLLGGSSAALAQKTKSKPQAEQTQQNSLDPNDPDDLEEIIAEADEAYFADNGGEPDPASFMVGDFRHPFAGSAEWEVVPLA